MQESETVTLDVAPAGMPTSTRVVFVRGTGRCGSKLLMRLLGQHSQIARPPVNDILPEELFDWSEARVRGYWHDAPTEALQAACRAYFEAFHQALTAPAPVLVQKNTMQAHRLSELLACWPDARMIYMVRHPLGVVESLINSNIHSSRKGQGFKATVANSLVRWYNDVQAYLDSEAFGHPRVLQIRFEDLVTQMPATIEATQRFIGVRPEAFEDKPEPERYDRRFVLNERERRWILGATRDIVGQLGYDASQWSAEVPARLQASLGNHPDRRLGEAPPALDGADLVHLAVKEAGRRGLSRLGLFGVGYFSRLVCPRIAGRYDEVVTLLDDDPLLVGRTICGFPVNRPEDAPGLGIQAAIPLSAAHQGTLVRKWRSLHGNDIPIIPLWEE